MHIHCLLGLKHMTTYKRVKPATAQPLVDAYIELKMLCLFYFALESEKMAIMQWYLKNVSFFPFYLFLIFFFISIPNVNCFLDQFTPQFINVVATINDSARVKRGYFAPKLWLYVMILLL